MHYSTALPFLSFLINFCTLTSILAQNKRDAVHRAYLGCTAALSCWSLVTCLLWPPLASSLIVPLLKIASLASLCIAFFSLNLAYTILRKQADRLYGGFLLVILASGALMTFTHLFAHGYSQHDWGTTQEAGPLFLPIVALALIAPACYAIVLLHRKRRAQPRQSVKKPLDMLYYGLSFWVILALVAHSGISHLGGASHYPSLAIPGTLIYSLCAFLAVRHYNRISMRIEEVATDIFMNIEDGIILIDDTEHIVQANHTAQTLLHMGHGENVKISDVFAEYDSAKHYKNEELVINHDGVSKVVTLSQATVLQSHRQRGTILIVRDITESKATEKALQDGKTKLENLAAELAQANASLEQKVVARTKSLLHSNEQLRQEIAERERAEEALAAEKERLAVTLSSIGDGVIRTDTTGHVILLNKVAEQLTGWQQAHAVHHPLEEIFRLVDEKTRTSCPSLVQDVLRTHAIVHRTRHTILIAADGTERLIAESGAPICAQDGTVLGAVLAFRDMTETRKIEEELIKADRLEAIGVLAGGIAHDFNNILTAILGNVALAKLYAEQDEKTVARLTNAEKAALRAQTLTQQLLTIAKGGTPFKQLSSIKELLQDSIAFSLRGSNVRCELDLSHNLWAVDVDEGQISQVINNLIINADQAMPDGGVIEVSAENIGLHEGRPEYLSALKKGDYVKISIRDEGNGIAEDQRQKIFDPYFTTKRHGSGLGLFTSYSIIKKHDGFIDVQSELGVGTTFSVYLPASSTHVVHPTPPDITPSTGTGTILVMEDEESLRDVIGNALGHYGYDVAFAQNGDEAIAVYHQHKDAGQPFDVVIMDLTIPGGMGGKETVAKLLAIDPDAKAIIASGYANDPIMTAFKEYGFCGCITKPYEAHDLHKILHDTIAGHNMTPTT